MATKSIIRDIVVSNNKIFREPKKEVLIIECVEVFDSHVACRIAYQDTDILKRDKFRDSELNVYSFSSFDYELETHTLYLRGEWKEEDNKVILLPIECKAMIEERVKEINNKYGRYKG